MASTKDAEKGQLNWISLKITSWNAIIMCVIVSILVAIMRMMRVYVKMTEMSIEFNA
jgi:hypothetical protein